MTIQFVASLQGSGVIRLDDDNSAIVKMTVDGSQIANVAKLITLKGKSFTVTIDVER